MSDGMRLLRKHPSSILTDDRISLIDDSSYRLYSYLCIAQDDKGMVPLSKTKLKFIITTTNWSLMETCNLLSNLITVGLIRINDDYVEIDGGAELNGTPSNSKKWPFIYSEPLNAQEVKDWIQSGYSTESVPSRSRVARVEKSRVEESKVEKDTPPDPRFIPLSILSGYRKITPKSVQVILKTAEIENVLVEDLIKSFVAYWEIGRIRHNWKDPVASMIKTLPIVVSKLKGELNGNYRQTTYPRNPRQGSERVWKSGSEWDRVRREIGRSLE